MVDIIPNWSYGKQKFQVDISEGVYWSFGKSIIIPTTSGTPPATPTDNALFFGCNF